MVRTYVRKTSRGIGGYYTLEAMISAVQLIRSRKLTLAAAAKKFKIPKSTIHYRLKNYKGVFSSAGGPTVLPYETEARLANAIRNLRKWGFRLSNKEITQFVSQFIMTCKIYIPRFKNNVPGVDWLFGFCKRHRLNFNVKSLNYEKEGDPKIISDYFTLLKKCLAKLDMEDRPNQIWNLTETSMELFSEQGTKSVTVLTTVNAKGHKLPPFMAFKTKQLRAECLVIEDTDNLDELPCFIRTNIIDSYLKKVFIPCNETTGPILILYDGKYSHLDLKAVEFARHHNITILNVPSPVSHQLQPLDSVFENLWEDKFVEWQRTHDDKKITKAEFVNLFAEIWNQTTSDMIINGFKNAGIHPFNSNVVPVGEYNTEAYKMSNKADMITSQVNLITTIDGPKFVITHDSSSEHSNISRKGELRKDFIATDESDSEKATSNLSASSQITGSAFIDVKEEPLDLIELTEEWLDDEDYFDLGDVITPRKGKL